MLHLLSEMVIRIKLSSFASCTRGIVPKSAVLKRDVTPLAANYQLKLKYLSGSYTYYAMVNYESDM